MNFVMDLEVEDFTLLVEELLKSKHEDLETKQEERFFNTWGYQLPVMKEPLSYHDFKKKHYDTGQVMPKRRKKKNYDKQIDKFEEIRKRHQAGK